MDYEVRNRFLKILVADTSYGQTVAKGLSKIFLKEKNLDLLKNVASPQPLSNDEKELIDVGRLIIYPAIIDKNGFSQELDLNNLAEKSATGELRNALEENENFIDEITGKRGAIKFVSLNYNHKTEVYCLNKDTLIRFVNVNLKPIEYGILMINHCGWNQNNEIRVPYELHDDFYLENGEALQPRREQKQNLKIIKGGR